jgi:hypothetical protein
VAWSGKAVRVSSSEVRAALKLIANDELGMVITCPCGASRWCPVRQFREDTAEFLVLHAGHVEPGG